MSVLLSILTPTLLERRDTFQELMDVLSPQLTAEVEFLSLLDTRQRQCGEKRNELMRMAKGKYLCHIDDDELVSPNFVAEILPMCVHDFDCIAYDGDASFDGSPPFRTITGMDYENEQPNAKPEGGFTDVKRKPWHWCSWRSELARQCKFPEHYDRAEDWTWLQQILPQVKGWAKIHEVLFHHRYNSKRTTFVKQ